MLIFSLMNWALMRCVADLAFWAQTRLHVSFLHHLFWLLFVDIYLFKFLLHVFSPFSIWSCRLTIFVPRYWIFYQKKKKESMIYKPNYSMLLCQMVMKAFRMDSVEAWRKASTFADHAPWIHADVKCCASCVRPVRAVITIILGCTPSSLHTSSILRLLVLLFSSSEFSITLWACSSFFSSLIRSSVSSSRISYFKIHSPVKWWLVDISEDKLYFY